jgi:hypothetical protein
VTTGTGEIGKFKESGGFAADWADVRADGDIQFAPITQAPPQSLEQQQPSAPPQWLVDFMNWLGDVLSPIGDFFNALGRMIGLSGTALLWILGVIAAGLVCLLVFRLTRAMLDRRRVVVEAEPSWTPDAGEALELLDDADRLAAEGRYDEATHLLLKRSVGQIAAARPDLLQRSSTAREISMLPALSEAARTAFATMAERVERSLFALRSLNADDWHTARAAYADFALAAPVA